MTEPLFIKLYEALIDAVDSLGLTVFSQAQDIEQVPACRISLLNSNGVDHFKNVKQYSYSFQLDIVTDKNELTAGLTYAYQLVKLLCQIEIEGCSLSFSDNGSPNLTSMVDTSTNRTLNRQIIRTTYQIIEDTVL